MNDARTPDPLPTGDPMTNSKGCKVTLFHVGTISAGGRTQAHILPTCDRPVVAHELCAKHYGDRVRLGGAL